MAKQKRTQTPAVKRAYLKQTDVPSASLTDALRLPQVIFDHYAGRPTSPLQIAKALNIDPRGTQIRVLSGAAIAFGLIEGGAQATTISVTDLARRIMRPKEEDEDILGKREAVLRPRVFGDFLRRYDGHAFPRQDIALNVIEEMGVPRDKLAEVVERIDASARSVGFIEEIKGKNYVTLQGVAHLGTVPPDLANQDDALHGDLSDPPAEAGTIVAPPTVQPTGATLTAAIAEDQRRRRVFVTHGTDLPLNFHPAAVRASANVTPLGAVSVPA